MYTYAYDILKNLLEADNRDHEVEGWAYFAACCEKLHKDDEFMAALEKACEVTPIEVSMVFGTDIPAAEIFLKACEYLKCENIMVPNISLADSIVDGLYEKMMAKTEE